MNVYTTSWLASLLARNSRLALTIHRQAGISPGSSLSTSKPHG